MSKSRFQGFCLNVQLKNIIKIENKQKGIIYKKQEKQLPWQTLIISENLSWKEFSKLNLFLHELPGAKPVFSVARQYPQAENFTHEQTAKKIISINPELAIFMIYGQQPSASTQCMPGGKKTCDKLNNLSSKFGKLEFEIENHNLTNSEMRKEIKLFDTQVKTWRELTKSKEVAVEALVGGSRYFCE